MHGRGAVYEEFPTRRAGLLLARLALDPRRSFSRTALCEMLWPDDDPQATRVLLRNELFRLRLALGTAAELIIADRTSIQFNAELGTTDLLEMMRSLNRAVQAEDLQTRIRQYERASDTDCSAILPEFDEDWIARERARYRNFSRQTLIGFGRARAESGDLEAGIECFEAAIQLEPAHEEAYIVAMGVLLDQARQQEALLYFKRLEAELTTTKGGPSTLARAAHDRCLVSAPEPSSAYGPSNIPAPLSATVGRQEEIEKIASWLDPAGTQARLVTLLGPAGIGKTRLSIESARRLLARYNSRVWFVDLADRFEPQEILAAILEVLRIEARGHQSPAEALKRALSQIPALLVLDNFEQLLEGGASVVGELLTENEPLRLLVTSRQRLNLSGEQEFVVSPLGIQGASCDAVTLFLQVAQTVQPRLPPDAETLAVIHEIVSKLEGIPLAIHLAASRCDVLSPKDLLNQLEDSFKLLVSRRRDLNRRDSNLKKTVEWSYRLMSADLQGFFTDLSVFHGGWTLESAAAILERNDTIEMLESLRDRSFIVAELGRHGMRFRMLETLRDFAAENLPDGRKTDLSSRHLSYFVRYFSRANNLLRGGDQFEWLDRMDLENENAVAALTWAADNDRSEALTLCEKLLRFWLLHGHHRDALAWMDRLFAPPVPLTMEVGHALFGAGLICQEQFDVRAAQTYFEDSLRVFTELGSPMGRCVILQNMACLHNDQGEFGPALICAQESYDYQVAQGRDIDSSFALDEIARSKLGRGDLDGALADAERTYSLRLRLESYILHAEAEMLIGEIRLHSGELDEAASKLESALAGLRKAKRTRHIAQAECLLAEIDLDRDLLEAAETRIRNVEQACLAAGLTDGLISAGLLRSRLLLAQNAPEKALEIARETLQMAVKQAVLNRVLSALDVVAICLHRTGDTHRAALVASATDETRRQHDLPRLPRPQSDHTRLLAALSQDDDYSTQTQEASTLTLDEAVQVATSG